MHEGLNLSSGTIVVTPDHVLLIDDAFLSARHATAGSKLTLANGSHSTVEHTTYLDEGRIINPVTTRGTILALASGAPILASTHPEWSAPFMLRNPAPLPYPCFNLLSIVFPELAQAYYDAVVDPAFRMPLVGRNVVQIATAVPSPLLGASVLAADAVAALGFLPYVCSSNMAFKTACARSTATGYVCLR